MEPLARVDMRGRAWGLGFGGFGGFGGLGFWGFGVLGSWGLGVLGCHPPPSSPSTKKSKSPVSGVGFRGWGSWQLRALFGLQFLVGVQASYYFGTAH